MRRVESRDATVKVNLVTLATFYFETWGNCSNGKQSDCKKLTLCRISWVNTDTLIWMIAVWNAVIKNNMSLIKCTNEAQGPARCTAAAHRSLLEDVYHCGNKFPPALLCVGMSAPLLFSCSASKIETRENLPQGHRIYLWSRGDLMESCCILESLRSILQTTELSSLFNPPLGLCVSHLQPLDLCMGLVVMHNG